MITTKEDRMWIIENSNTGGIRKFSSLIAVVFWGDTSNEDENIQRSAAILGGEQEDGRINIFKEVRDWSFMLHEPLIEWKDIFLIQKIYAPIFPFPPFKDLQKAEGLSYYPVMGEDKKGRPIYKYSPPTSRWKTFKNYGVTAPVCAISDMVFNNLEPLSERINRFIAEETILLDRKSCPLVEASLYLSPKIAFKHPILKAVISLVAILTSKKHPAKRPFKQEIWWKEYRGQRGK